MISTEEAFDRRIAVTGGSGRLGRAIVKALSADYEVVSLDIAQPEQSSPWRQVDVTKADGLREALEGQDAVVHAAGLLLPEDQENEIFRVNVLGTWNVLRAAEQAGVKKLIFISSETATGIVNITGTPPVKPDYLPIDEAHPLRPREAYGVSKQLCEVIASSFASRGAMEIIVLRPTLILMPGMEDYVRAMRCGDLHDGWSPDLWSYVVVWDVIAAVCSALRKKGTTFAIYYVSAEDTFCEEPTLSFMQRRFGKIAEIRNRDLYQANPHAAIWDISKARRELAFAPQYDWRQFLAMADKSHGIHG